MKSKFYILKLAKDHFTKILVPILAISTKNKNNFILYFDFCLMILVGIFLMCDLFFILNLIIDKYLNLGVEICNINVNTGTTSIQNNTTNTTIILDRGA